MGQQREEKAYNTHREIMLYDKHCYHRDMALFLEKTQRWLVCAATINKMNYNKNRKEKRRKRATWATIAVTWGCSWTKEDPVEQLRMGPPGGRTGQKGRGCTEDVDRVQEESEWCSCWKDVIGEQMGNDQAGCNGKGLREMRNKQWFWVLNILFKIPGGIFFYAISLTEPEDR